MLTVNKADFDISRPYRIPAMTTSNCTEKNNQPDSFGPTSMMFILGVQSPASDSELGDLNHLTKPLCLRFEFLVAQETTDENRDFILRDRQAHQAISLVAQFAIVEAEIARKESRAALLVQ
jgi:hypothetical protein